MTVHHLTISDSQISDSWKTVLSVSETLSEPNTPVRLELQLLWDVAREETVDLAEDFGAQFRLRRVAANNVATVIKTGGIGSAGSHSDEINLIAYDKPLLSGTYTFDLQVLGRGRRIGGTPGTPGDSGTYVASGTAMSRAAAITAMTQNAASIAASLNVDSYNRTTDITVTDRRVGADSGSFMASGMGDEEADSLTNLADSAQAMANALNADSHTLDGDIETTSAIVGGMSGEFVAVGTGTTQSEARSAMISDAAVKAREVSAAVYGQTTTTVFTQRTINNQTGTVDLEGTGTSPSTARENLADVVETRRMSLGAAEIELDGDITVRSMRVGAASGTFTAMGTGSTQTAAASDLATSAAATARANSYDTHNLSGSISYSSRTVGARSGTFAATGTGTTENAARSDLTSTAEATATANNYDSHTSGDVSISSVVIPGEMKTFSASGSGITEDAARQAVRDDAETQTDAISNLASYSVGTISVQAVTMPGRSGTFSASGSGDTQPEARSALSSDAASKASDRSAVDYSVSGSISESSTTSGYNEWSAVATVHYSQISRGTASGSDSNTNYGTALANATAEAAQGIPAGAIAGTAQVSSLTSVDPFTHVTIYTVTVAYPWTLTVTGSSTGSATSRASADAAEATATARAQAQTPVGARETSLTVVSDMTMSERTTYSASATYSWRAADTTSYVGSATVTWTSNPSTVYTASATYTWRIDGTIEWTATATFSWSIEGTLRYTASGTYRYTIIGQTEWEATATYSWSRPGRRRYTSRATYMWTIMGDLEYMASAVYSWIITGTPGMGGVYTVPTGRVTVEKYSFLYVGNELELLDPAENMIL